jgi:hypothetical protein
VIRTHETLVRVFLDKPSTFRNLFHHGRNRVLEAADLRQCVNVHRKPKHVDDIRQQHFYLGVAILLVLQNL